MIVCCTVITAPTVLNGKTPDSPGGSSRMTLTSYLLLDGTCKPAMEFYQTCFGGELTMTLVGNSPMKTAFPATMQDKVVNSRLVSGDIVISASDWLRPQEKPIQGNTVCLYLSAGSYEELKTVFNKLAVGATVTDPLREEVWGAYGALNDRFGIRWMFHAGKRAEPTPVGPATNGK